MTTTETTRRYCPACEETTDWTAASFDQRLSRAVPTEPTTILIALNCTVCGY